MQYEGTPPARIALRERARSADVVVMSYETLRADADWTSAHPWAYCVLDEGHIIRNPKSKIAQVIAQNLFKSRFKNQGVELTDSFSSQGSS